MNQRKFPTILEVPHRLEQLDGNCGVVAVWMVLEYFGIKHRVDDLIHQCHHTDEYGTFTAGLALALHDYGLHVQLHTEPDDDMKPLEQSLYEEARNRNIVVAPAISLDKLLALLSRSCKSIVFFDTDDGCGHFSPLSGVRGKNLLLPYTENGSLPRETFVHRWNAPEILQQCVVVSKD